jgi:transcriptional regulator with XRE-family HTH domain
MAKSTTPESVQVTTFGQLFKAMRLRLGKTLREFCLEHGLDPGNVSKMERGILPPPQGKEKLEQYATFLGLKRGSTEWFDFFDLAAAEAGRLPPDLADDERLLPKLPAIFRTLRGTKPTQAQLDALVRLLRVS